MVCCEEETFEVVPGAVVFWVVRLGVTVVAEVLTVVDDTFEVVLPVLESCEVCEDFPVDTVLFTDVDEALEVVPEGRAVDVVLFTVVEMTLEVLAAGVDDRAVV